MTSNNLQTWQQALNPKLVHRLNNRLTKPGMINNGMAKKIIERSPDMLNRLPLLAQQMQRWSTTIDLESEPIPIVYVQNQAQRSQAVEKQTINSRFPSSNINQGNKQLPVVKAKLVPVKKTPLQNQRSQSPALALTQDHPLPNLASEAESSVRDSLTNKTSISNSLISSNTITPQHKLDTDSAASLSLPVVKVNSEQFSPQNTSLTVNPETPLVHQLSQSTIQKKPLVNLESASDLAFPIQRKLDTDSAASLSLPVVKVNSEQFSPQNTSLTVNPETPLVHQLSQPTVQKKPLVNLESASDLAFPIQRKLDTDSAASLSLPVVKVSSEQFSPQNTSLTVNPETPLVHQLSQPTVQKKPLVNLESASDLAFPIQRKLDNESADSLSLPVVKVNSEQLSSLNEPMLLLEEFKKTNPSVVTDKIENISKSSISNKQSHLPVVQVNHEPYLLEFEPLILSTSTLAKQKSNNLNSSKLNQQTNWMATANDNGTSFTNQQTSITNSTHSNQTTIASHSSINSHPPPVNQSHQNSVLGVSQPPQIDVDALVDKVERKIMRRLVVESERRGKRKWR